MKQIPDKTRIRLRWKIVLPTIIALLAGIFLSGAVYESRHPFLPGDYEFVVEDPGITHIDELIEICEPKLDPVIRKFYAFHINQFTQMYGVQPELAVAVLNHEGHWNPLAISKSKAEGLGQIMAKHHKDMIERNGGTIDQICYVDVSIRSCCEFLSSLLKQFPNNPRLAIASYNCGPNHDAIKEGRIPQNGETPQYLRDVMLTYANLALCSQRVAMR